MLLELDNIGKSYGDARVLAGVGLSLDRGQSVAVVAPSGAGKSTLLSIAGLLLEPTEGRVLLDGEDAGALDDDARSHLRADKIGFLFQHTQMVGALRAIENVQVPTRFSRGGKADAAAAAEAALVALGLEDRIYHYPHQLSIGQKRRVAAARALVNDPDLIIADEPTNDLDEQNAKKVVEALFERVRTGRSGLLYATHDRELASRADRIVDLAGM